MDGHTYVTRGYSNYADAPAQEGGYLYGSDQNVNWYVVETTTIERVRAPSGYTSYGSDPFKEYMPKYAPMNHHEGGYGSNYELSSAHGYLDQENLMNDFLKQIQIGASRPMKPSGPNRYRPTSPNKYRPKSPTHGYPSKDAYPIRAQNMQGPAKYPLRFPTHGYPSKEAYPIRNTQGPTKYQPTSLPKYRPLSPTKYHPTSPTKYRPTSPDKYRPASPSYSYPTKEAHVIKAQNIPGPNKYRPSSPTKYRPTSPTKYRPTSPIKYRPTSPIKYRPTSPTKYRPTSPTSPIKYRPTSPIKYRPTSPIKYRPTSPTKYRPTSPTKYRPASPTKYRPTSPTKYRPTSPTRYRPTSPPKYQPTSPPRNYPSKEDNPIKGQKSSGWTNLPKPIPVHTLPSKEIQPIRTESFSSPNKQHPTSPGSEGGQYAKAGEFSGPANLLHNGPPNTTNKLNEAYHVAEPVTNSPRSDPKSGGVFNKFFTRAQPTYGKATNRGLFGSNTIDSQEAIKKYNGANVP